MKDIKVVFMGTPEFAVPVLEVLMKNVEVMLVVTQPDKLVGRKQELRFSPIKEVAIKNGIEVFQPAKIKIDFERILELKPDLIITCAYGQLIPNELLNLPRLGCVNVHASALPKLRGGAPIHHAIIDGYDYTGATIMYMDEAMDTGDIISIQTTKIEDDDNVGILHDRLSLIGANLLERTLPSIIDGTNNRDQQNADEATYGYNIKREEEQIDFNKTCRQIFNQVRGLNPWPVANLILDGEEIKVLECYYEGQITDNISVIENILSDAIGISCVDGIVYLTKIKPFGKKTMLVRDYLNGVEKQNLIGKKVN